MYSFVIPCYKSGDRLAVVVNSIVNYMAQQDIDNYEIVLVNDCSPDETWSNIVSLSKDNKRIVGIDLARNSGQANALMAGFRYSSGDYVVTMEDDGQSPVEDALRLLSLLDDDHDIACARNVTVPKRGIVRTVGRYVNWLVLDFFLNRPEGVSPAVFFAAKRCVITEMLHYTNPYVYLGGLMLRSTSKFAHLDIERKDRMSGSSGYSLNKLAKLLFNGITTFSTKPLGIGWIASIVSFLLFIILLITIVIFSSNASIFENITMYALCSLILIGFLILLVVSLIGEYIGRIYMCINSSPQYIVRQRASRGEVRFED